MPNLNAATDLEDEANSVYSNDSLDEQSKTNNDSQRDDTLEQVLDRSDENNGESTISGKGNKEEVLVPFYNGDLSLQELRILQKHARKKVKHLTCNNEASDCEKSCNEKKSKEELLSLHLLSPRSDSLNSVESETTKSFCSSRINDSKESSNSESKRNGRTKADNCKVRRKSVSYLDQYRKKLGINKKHIRTPSECSTAATSIGNRTPLTYSDFSDGDCSRSLCLLSQDDDEFYRNIINNKAKKQLSSTSDSSLYNSCEESVGEFQNFSQEDLKLDLRVKRKTQKNESKSKEQRTKSVTKPKFQYQDPVVGKLGRLGPDIDTIRQKLEVLNKRKSYGNTVSSKNRLDIIQKREIVPVKGDLPPESYVRKGKAVPVVTVTVDMAADDTGTAAESPTFDLKHKKVVKKRGLGERDKNVRRAEKEINVDEKHCSGKGNGEMSLNRETTEMLLIRHELEKKMADQIRDQLKSD